MISPDTRIYLIAPNVSEQMGGEGIKALQIFLELKKLHPNTVQITHARNRSEVQGRLALPDVHFIEDDRVSLWLWKSVWLRFFLDAWFSRLAVAYVDDTLRREGNDGRHVIVHQTEPNSPVVPRSVSRRAINVFGPINGNIYYPPAFRKDESTKARLRRVFHRPAQWFNRVFSRGLPSADLIFYAGGERTARSLALAGCPARVLSETVDCGITDRILDRARLTHQGVNTRYVHFGRLVFHKGTALIIEALPQTKQPIQLDIVGRGPELDHCKQLVARLGLQSRVRFLDWYPKHSDLLDSFSQYRGVLLPSIEDANGIVVQEAMAVGLVPICLDWGGPQLLVEDGVSGYLVEPGTREAIVCGIAQRLDTLAADGALAESMSVAARQRAETWRWSVVLQTWLARYPTR